MREHSVYSGIVMKLAELLAFLLSVGLAAQAQQEMKVEVSTFHYPTLAASARIRGDVIFEVSGTERKLVSGHPLLAPAAGENLATWALPLLDDGKYVIVYHFELLSEGGVKHENVLVGNRIERFFKRLVGAPTEKVTTTCYPANDPTPDPRSHYTIAKEVNLRIEVFVGKVPRCLNTETSHL